MTKIPRSRRGVPPWKQGGQRPTRRRIRAVRKAQRR